MYEYELFIMFDILCFCRRLIQDGSREICQLCVHNYQLVRIKNSIDMVPFQEQSLRSEGKVRKYKKETRILTKTPQQLVR